MSFSQLAPELHLPPGYFRFLPVRPVFYCIKLLKRERWNAIPAPRSINE
jgi:hypothetical protein